FPAQPTLPFVQILTLEGIDRLIITAVMFAVADEISNQPTTQAGALRPRRAYLDWPIGGLLADPRPPDFLVRIGSWTAQIDRVALCHRARLRRAKKCRNVAEELRSSDKCVSAVSIHNQLSARQPARGLSKHLKCPEGILCTADHECLRRNVVESITNIKGVLCSDHGNCVGRILNRDSLGRHIRDWRKQRTEPARSELRR